MPDPTLLALLLTVLVASYVQAVAGFALGMIIIAVSSAADLLPLPVLAAVVSLLSLFNIVLSLHGRYHLVHGLALKSMAWGVVPGTLVGVLLLGWLSTAAAQVLQGVLGAFIVAASLSMMLRPVPQAAVAGRRAFVAAGLGGGILGGLFAAGGPVIGWFTYRQPLPLAEIRATLLGTFAISTVSRTVFVGAEGGLDAEVLRLTLWSLPVVLVGTLLGRHLPPPWSEEGLKRAAFGLLVVAGVITLLRAFGIS